ncbi:MAG: PAC2 family protein [Chloroflexi bacterium]|nr:PAC2 family protein [Chloroflexota bacterium]
MNGPIRFHAHPRLKKPSMVAVWPGVANVAMIVAAYLKSKLAFKELGEIEASHFFDPVGIAVRNNLVESPQFPQSKFYYLENEGDGGDLILFIGDDQPVLRSYELAQCVMDAGQDLHVKRIYTCAAALSRIHHTEQPRVWGVATAQPLLAELQGYGLAERGSFQIAGLNGLALGVAAERGIEGVCLLAEVPKYASRVPNPTAALAIVEVLSRILGIKVDTLELSQQAEVARERMKEMASQAMGEYIDLFTEPIWEQGEEEDEEEEE